MKKPNKSLKKTLKKGGKKPTSFITQFIIVIVVFIVMTAIFVSVQMNQTDIDERSISELVSDIEEGVVSSLEVRGDRVSVTYDDDEEAIVQKERGVAITETLSNYGLSGEDVRSITISIEDERGFLFWVGVIVPFLLPLLILVVLVWIFLSQIKSTGSKAFSFGKSRARFIHPDDTKNKITFDDVAGLEEEKEELQEFVTFLKTPKKYEKIGAKVPKGFLLVGPPGTGKTLLARAVAGEANAPFFSVSGSEFVELFVGIGASRVRDLFNNAKKHSPSVIFIDEIDAVGRVRGSGVGGGNDEREQTLNQILVEMDGFEPNDNVIVIAATNCPQVLDPALLRPGRFDRRVIINFPNKKEREGIIKVHTKGKPLAKDVNFDELSRITIGRSGADIQSMANEAAILAVRDKREIIHQRDFKSALEKVLYGPERKRKVSSEYEKYERKVVAYHEGGHALLSSILPYADPVQKITIIARGHALGYVISTPDDDQHLHVRQKFIDDITMILGGYVTEKLVFGDVSTGPSNDLEKVTEIARDMVMRFGMSDKLGPIVLNRKEASQVGMIREKLSQDTEKKIDAEVSKIINQALKNATKIIKKHRKVLDELVEKLFEVETMDREEYEKFLKDRGVAVQNILLKA